MKSMQLIASVKRPLSYQNRSKEFNRLPHISNTSKLHLDIFKNSSNTLKTKFEIIEISNPNATIHAPSFGLFDRLIKAGDTVSKGQLAGWFHYISESDRESIKLKFTHSGKILAHSNRGVVDKGEMLALVANDYEAKE